MQGAVCAESGKAETSPLGSPPKAECWTYAPTLFHLRVKLGDGFSPILSTLSQEQGQ